MADPDERVDRQWLQEFCDKQEGWREPEFWFSREIVANAVGRPDKKDRPVEIYFERRQAEISIVSVAAEGRNIHNLLLREMTSEDAADPKTIEKYIREIQREQ